MTEIDPYTPPSPGPLTFGGEPAALGELVRGWEKLRLVYNGIMILPGICVLALWVSKMGMPVPGAIVSGLFTGLGANAAFFLGPVSELYLRGLFRQGAPIGKGRMLIFAAGLVVSAGTLLIATLLAIAAPPL
jgi:hypothetical protein